MFPEIKNPYLRFILNLLVLILILIVIDRVAGNIAKRFYFSQVAGVNYRTTYSMDSTTAEILVFGSSRANHHYVPEVFEDSLNMSFYNTGRDGDFLLSYYAIFQSVIKRYNPRIIILDINPGDLFYNKPDYDRLSSLLPYYEGHPEIQPILELRGEYEKYKMLSAIYPYNSTLIGIAMGNLEYNKTRNADNKGYIPLQNQMAVIPPRSVQNRTGQIDSVKYNALESMMIECKSRNIKLFISISPMHTIIENDSSTLIIASMSKKHSSGFHDFSNEATIASNPSNFQDEVHLNNTGAIYFSSLVAHLIKTNSY